MKLYDYVRSSAAFRVRIVLNLKKISYEKIPIHLLNQGGEQLLASYRSINPQALIPALILENGITLTQSLAIIEYLEEKYPEHPILPSDLIKKSHIRAIANIVACDIHPLNNLRVLKYLQNILNISDEQKNTWYTHWIEDGFHAIEAMLPKLNTLFSFDNNPCLADVYLVPQIFNAKRFNCNMSSFPVLAKIYQNALKHEAFSNAFPDN